MPDYASTNASGVMVISRAVSGVAGLSTFTQLYSGAPLAYYVDPGEFSPGPLIAASGYVYAVTDLNGTTQVGPVYPAQTIPIKPDGMTRVNRQSDVSSRYRASAVQSYDGDAQAWFSAAPFYRR